MLAVKSDQMTAEARVSQLRELLAGSEGESQKKELEFGVVLFDNTVSPEAKLSYALENKELCARVSEWPVEAEWLNLLQLLHTSSLPLGRCPFAQWCGPVWV